MTKPTKARVFDDPEYVDLEAARLSGRVEWLTLGDNRRMGLIARAIPGTDLRDLVSVYGYPELLSGAAGHGPAAIDRLLAQFAGIARQRGLVAAYLRLGLAQEVPQPTNCNAEVLAQRVTVGEVVAVDLSLSPDSVLSGYRKQLRYDLKRPHGLVLERSGDLDAFHDIYTQNMVRVGATASYFFDAAYLKKLASFRGAELWVARDSEGVVAGGLFLQQGDLMFYHLGATADRALATSPLKHVLHHRIQSLAGTGTQYLVLGGGVGGGEDALLRFKRGFSKLMLPVHALRVILDPAQYAKLSRLPVQPPAATGFFPAYRSQVWGPCI